MLNFKSQFSDGYDYPNDSVPISRFLAPAYILYSLGLDYKPNDKFSLFFSPITGKITIVSDGRLAAEGAFGVEPAKYDKSGVRIQAGKNVRYEFGAYLKSEINKNLMENVSLQSKLELFSSYDHNPQNVDVNWEVLIVMKINKFLSANVNTNLVYDDDIKITDKNGKVLQEF